MPKKYFNSARKTAHLA